MKNLISWIGPSTCALLLMGCANGTANGARDAGGSDAGNDSQSVGNDAEAPAGDDDDTELSPTNSPRDSGAEDESSGNEDATTDAPEPDGFISSEGGSVYTEDGVILVVGSESIAPEGVITVEPTEAPESAAVDFVSGAWLLEPAGTIFDPPARLTLQFSDVLAEGRPVAIYQLQEDGQWLALEDCEPHYSDVNCFLERTGTVAVALLPELNPEPDSPPADAGPIEDAGPPNSNDAGVADAGSLDASMP